MKRKIKGFTLVELVITIAIVIILSVISVPIYRGYVDKAIESEGYALLGTILSAEKAYYSEYGNFLNGSDASNKNKRTSCEPILGIDIRGNKYFTNLCIGDSGNVAKYYFDAYAILPDDLGKKTGKTALFLIYNITQGPQIVWNGQFKYDE